MKTKFLCVFILLCANVHAQNNASTSPMDPLSYGVVLDDSGMKNVIVKKILLISKMKRAARALIFIHHLR